jgi:hypothetical protein
MTEIPDDLKPGDRVHVEFDAEVRHTLNDYIELASDGVNFLLRPEHISLKITRNDPENWPPQAGDVWEADGKVWFAQYTESGIRMVHAEGGWPLIPVDHKTLNPVLKYRQEAS